MSGVTVWTLASVCLTLLTLLLGRAKIVTPTAAAGVVVLGTSLGAILKAAGASASLAAPLVLTVSFVVMTAAAGFQKSPSTRDRVIAGAFWLLGAMMLAGSTWLCVFGE